MLPSAFVIDRLIYFKTMKRILNNCNRHGANKYKQGGLTIGLPRRGHPLLSPSVLFFAHNVPHTLSLDVIKAPPLNVGICVTSALLPAMESSPAKYDLAASQRIARLPCLPVLFLDINVQFDVIGT
jgi:hypothetical protein